MTVVSRWTIRPAYRGELAPPLYRSQALLLALLLLPLPVIVFASTRRPRKRVRTVSPAVTLRALAPVANRASAVAVRRQDSERKGRFIPWCSPRVTNQEIARACGPSRPRGSMRSINQLSRKRNTARETAR